MHLEIWFRRSWGTHLDWVLWGMFMGFTASNAESAPRDSPAAHRVDPQVASWLKGRYPRSDQDVNKPYTTRSKKYGESQEKKKKKPKFRMCGSRSWSVENSSSQIHKTENWKLGLHQCLIKTKFPLVRNKLITEPIQL